MINTNIKLTITLLLITLSIFIYPIDAISAGVSPPKITIKNVQSGNNYNLSFAVYNMGNQTTDYSIEVNGNISNWTYINITKVQVKGKSNYPVSGIIKVPSNAPTGNYTGSILIKSIPSSNITGNKVSVGVNLPIVINITGKSIEISIKNSSNNISNNQNNKASGFESMLLFIVIVILIILQKTKR